MPGVAAHSPIDSSYTIGQTDQISNAPQASREDTLTVWPTDPDQEILLAEDRGVTDAMPVPLPTTYRKFFEYVSAPATNSNQRDGPGWITGPCQGRRIKANIKEFHLAVWDADSTLGKDGQVSEGAPAPDLVHSALVQYGITHHIYSTFGNGAKGYRYRILFPCRLYNAAQLRGFMMYIAELLQIHAQIPIHLTTESVNWLSRWHYPRVPYKDAPFFSATYYGNTLDAMFLAKHYGQIDSQGSEVYTEIPPTTVAQGDTDSLIGQFCALVSLPALLAENGYTYCGQGVITTPSGMETPTLRFKPQGSSSQAGVVCFEVDGRWRVFSHHTNDVLANGYLNDAWDVVQMLVEMEEGITAYAIRMIEDLRVAQMESDFPVVMESGSRFRVARVLPSDTGDGLVYRYLKFEDFKLHLCSYPTIFEPVKGADAKGAKLRNLAEWWRDCPRKKIYADTTFEPVSFLEKAERDIHRRDILVFNTFQGWNLLPNERASYGLIDWHVRYVLCGGNEVHYQYFLDWLAHLLQFPTEKPNVAPVMRGMKGTGKSLFWSYLAKRIGPIGAVIANARQLTGNFNAHLQHRLLGVVEESFWAGNPSDEGVLKHLISDTETMTERKGIDASDSRSFIRIVLITNNDWAAPASEDERRYFIPEISRAGIDENQRTGTYFAQLAMQLAGDGLPAFLTMVARRKIDKNAVRKAPPSAELMRQKLMSLNGQRAWVYDFLSHGAITGQDGTKVVLEPSPKQTVVPLPVLEYSSAQYKTRYEAARSTTAALSATLREYFGELSTTEYNGVRSVIFPGLDLLRQRFADKLGDPDFSWNTL